MPFFSKNITDLATSDLEELLAEEAVENVRLEFKSQPPGPDETLKKLSGFANTFGGYLIVGASAPSSNGRLVAYPGVEPQPNYRQTIIQRCYEGIWPPIEVLVSDGIPAPDTDDKVCYVIYVSESWEAPHFLTKRRGAWIRTDEFSQRFDTKLATFEEIHHLANRRRLAVERHEYLHSRAVGRFETLVAGEYSDDRRTSGTIGATLHLSICPQFPVRRLIEEQQILSAVKSKTIAWRGHRFPSGTDTITQQDSVLILHPARAFSVVEANVWGQLMYSCEIERLEGEGEQQVACIHLHYLLGNILVFLEYARIFYGEIGCNGPLLLRTSLKRVQGKPFLYFRYNLPEIGPSSRIDNEISFDISSSTVRLNEQRDEVASDLFKVLFFSLNWSQQGVNTSRITELLNAAKSYNSWH